MKHFIRKSLPIFLGGVIALAASCTKEDGFDEPTLTLSETAVSFDKGMSEKTVTITTNQASWIASSPAEGDWLAVTSEENVLKIKVLENTRGSERKTYVLVNAGGASAKLEVTQSAADITLDVIPDTIYMPQTGGERTVDITTNATSYEIVPEETTYWLTIDKHDEDVKLRAEANNTERARSVKLYARSGEKAKEIVVAQSGRLKYILAINPGNPMSVHKMMDFELSRGSYLRNYQAAYPNFGMPEMYTFVTASPIFKLIEYSSYDGVVPSGITTVGDGMIAVNACKDKAFERFLEENGYRRVNANSAKDFVNESAGLTLNVTISEREGNEGVNLTFRPFLKQDKKYPTFEAMPYFPLELLRKENKKEPAVVAYETAAGSTLVSRTMSEINTSEVSIMQYKMKAGSTDAFYGRAYFFFTTDPKVPVDAKFIGSVETGVLLFKNVNLGLWRNGTDWHVTEEFKELLGQEGFEFNSSSGNRHFFIRSYDHLRIAVTPIKDDDETVLALLFNYGDAAASGSAERGIPTLKNLLSGKAARKTTGR